MCEKVTSQKERTLFVDVVGLFHLVPFAVVSGVVADFRVDVVRCSAGQTVKDATFQSLNERNQKDQSSSLSRKCFL